MLSFGVAILLGSLVEPVLANPGTTASGAASLPAPSPPADAQHRLSFSVGSRGLDSLSFNDESLLASSKDGELKPTKGIIRAVIDALFSTASPSPVPIATREGDTIELFFPWGRVSCSYRRKSENALVMRVEVVNTTTQRLDEIGLRLVELTFPTVPKRGTLDAGLFGFGFRGNLNILSGIPVIADPTFIVPIVRVDYGSGALNFCSDDLEASIGMSFSSNPTVETRYPFNVTLRDIKPAESKTFTVSFRFGPAGATAQELAGDVIANYQKRYPFQVSWSDHRPIGSIFLASSAIKVPTNPRRWSFNSGKTDITTAEGKAAFREGVLQLANRSINVLKEVNAQGMITWDPEGQEFLGATYYGDPRLTPRLAPEMELKDESGRSVIDEYFARFTAAGLKVGVCIRPQQITFKNARPIQLEADDEHAPDVLKAKIAYARKRWGCTLFYVDSNGVPGRALYPDVFQAVANAYPDVLLIPEVESMRYFAYSAPFNSYVHHKVTSTPVGVRLVYPQAFSALLAPEVRPEDHDALLAAVRKGDVLIFNGWYPNAGAETVKRIYQEAGLKTAGLHGDE